MSTLLAPAAVDALGGPEAPAASRAPRALRRALPVLGVAVPSATGVIAPTLADALPRDLCTDCGVSRSS
jgi:hypothetical protein